MAFSLDWLSRAALAHPGVLEVEVVSNVDKHTVAIDLKVVERGFDLMKFKRAMRDLLPVGIGFTAGISGEVDPTKPNPFEHVVFKDYDENMSDAELALRLKTLRG